MITNIRSFVKSVAAFAVACTSLLPVAQAAVPGIKITKLYSPTPGATHYFGSAVVVTDRYAVVGEPSFSGGPAGVAHVYDAVTGAFVRTLKPTDSASGDEFGQTIAAHGTKVLIGTGKNTGANAAYLFDLLTGKQLAKYQGNSGAASDRFSWALALTDTYAICADTGSSMTAGKVYVFNIATGTSVTLTAPDGGANDLFGYSIYCHDSLAVFGAPGHSGNKGAVYRWDLSTGQFIGKVMPPGLAANDYFAASISGNGQHLIVTANQDDVNAVVNAGSVYAVNLDGTVEASVVSFDPTPGTNRYFGWNLAQQGNLLVTRAGTDVLIADATRREVLLTIPESELSPGSGPMSLASHRLLLGDYNDTLLGTDAGAAYLIQTLPEPLSGTSLAARGDSAPGAAGIIYNGLEEAAITANGKVTIASTLTGSGSNANKDMATWSDLAMSGVLDLSLKSRDDLGSGVKVAAVNGVSANLNNLTIMQATLAGTGVTTANNRALFRDNGASTALFLRTGQTISSATSMDGTTLLGMAQVVQGGSSQVGASVTLRSGLGGVTTASDSGLLIVNGTNGSTMGTEREGSPVNGMNGVNYAQFAPRVALQNLGCAFTAALSGPVASNQAVFAKTAANAAVALAVKGQPAPGTTGPVFSSFLGETVNAAGRGHFRATISGAGVTAANNEGIWFYDGAMVKLAARTGDPVAGMTGVVWSRFLYTWPQSGRIIIRALLRGTGVTAANDEIVALYQEDGSIYPLLREGDTVPDCDGLRAGPIQRVEVAGIGGEYRILVPLIGAAATRNQALLGGNTFRGAVGATNALRRAELMLRKGTLIAAPLGAKCSVTGIAFANAKTQDTSGIGCKGLPTIISDSGTLLKLTLSDGSSQIVKFE